MSGLSGRDPAEVFSKFRKHIASLLNQTVTHSHVACRVMGVDSAELTFLRGQSPVAAPLNKSHLHLYLGQLLRAEKQSDGDWRLRTMQYAYKIVSGPGPDADYYFRFEYISREKRDNRYPRHHLHLPVILDCGDLDELHVPTGWVSIEELIRFLIADLGVEPHTDKWDDVLRESEELLKAWTGRRI